MRYLHLSFAALAAFIGSPRAHAEQDMWNGPYAGLTLGYETGDAKIKSTESGNGYSSSQSNKLSFKGPGAELVAGWGKLFNRYYLGLEGSATLYNSRGNARNSSVDGLNGTTNNLYSRVTRTDSFGLVARAGYKLHDNMLLYVKAGAASSKFNLRTINTNLGDPLENFSKKSQKRLTGFVGGLGTEVKLTDYLLGRLEASHTEYNTISLKGHDANNSQVRFKPQSSEIKAGIILPIKWK